MPKVSAKEASVVLTPQEHAGLVDAIESAIQVRDLDQLYAWIRGPFRSLLPHDSVMCIDFDAHNELHRAECLYHLEMDASICPVHGSHCGEAGRVHADGRRQSCVLDAAFVNDLLDAAADGHVPEHGPLCDAVVHSTRFLNGASYFVVLFNLPAVHRARARHLLSLLSSHIKMALAQVIDLPVETASRPLNITPREREIIDLMQLGLSNQEISASLGISPITLKSHIRKIYRKLDVQNREAALSAYRRLESPVASGLAT